MSKFHTAVYGEVYNSSALSGEDIYGKLNEKYSISAGQMGISFIKNINKGFKVRDYEVPGNLLPYNGTLMAVSGMTSEIHDMPHKGYNTSTLSIFPENKRVTGDLILEAFNEIKEVGKKSNNGTRKLTIGTHFENNPVLEFFDEKNKYYPVWDLNFLRRKNPYGEAGNNLGIYYVDPKNVNKLEETQMFLDMPNVQTLRWDMNTGSNLFRGRYTDVTFVLREDLQIRQEKAAKREEKSFLQKFFLA